MAFRHSAVSQIIYKHVKHSLITSWYLNAVPTQVGKYFNTKITFKYEDNLFLRQHIKDSRHTQFLHTSVAKQEQIDAGTKFAPNNIHRAVTPFGVRS